MTKLFRSLLVALTIFSVAPSLEAQSSPPSVDVTTFTTVPGSDVSAILLNYLFGPAFGQVTGFTASVQDNTSIDNSSQVSGGLLGTLSTVLNASCMVLVAIVVIWGVMTANLSAAYEGVEAARRYNTLWVPLRSTMSFGFLAPYAGGYSLIQTLVMKLALLSIGMANAAFGGVMQYVVHKQPVSMPDVPGSYPLAINILHSEVCMAALNSGGASLISRTPANFTSTTANSSPLAGYVTNAIVASATDILGTHFGSGAYSTRDTYSLEYQVASNAAGLPPDACGSYTISLEHVVNSNSLGSAQTSILSAKATATAALASALQPVAQDIVNATQPGTAPVTGTINSAGSASDIFSGDRSTFYSAMSAYDNSLVSATTSAISSLNGTYGNQPNGGNSSQIQQQGWIMAGAIYWDLMAVNRNIADALGEINPGNPPQDEKIMSEFSGMNVSSRNTYEQALTTLQGFEEGVMANQASDASMANVADSPNYHGLANATDPSAGAWDKMKALFGLMFSSGISGVGGSQNFGPTEYMLVRLTAQGDFLGNMQSLGQSLFGWGTGIFTITAPFIIASKSSAIEEVANGKSLLGKVVGFVGGGIVIGIIKDIAALALFVCIPLIIAGIVLGFYLPSIPMITWTVNVVGWMISVVKAVFAAPVWAAAHAIPEGDGWAGQAARQGYLLIFGVVLRPLLLLSGLFAGMLMIQAAGKVVGILFPVMIRSVSADTSVGLYSNLVFIAILAGLLITLAHKCFAMSHEMADEILKWIGGGHESLGDAGHHRDLRDFIAGSLVGGAAGAARSAMTPRQPNDRARRGGGGGGGGNEPNQKSDSNRQEPHMPSA